MKRIGKMIILGKEKKASTQKQSRNKKKRLITQETTNINLKWRNN